jgi:hypothetical protein
MESYLGIFDLEDTFPLSFVTANANGQVQTPDSSPTYRGYGPSGPLDSSSGTAARYTSGATITNATVANPSVITTNAAHGLATGDVVFISGVLGTTTVNGVRTVTVLSSTTFSVGVAGVGAYTSGGVFSLNGMWKIELAATEANGYDAGNFTIEVNWAVSAVQYKKILNITLG